MSDSDLLWSRVALLEQSNQLTSSASAARDGASHSYKSVDQLGNGASFIAVSPAMHALREYAEALANIDAPALITGEVGSGKETVARLIHSLSQRSANRFLAINCAGMPGYAFAKELLGTRSNTPASSPSRESELGNCQRGTVFLSDILDLPQSNQAQLIYILKKRQFFRNGSSAPADVDVRILAATGSPLERALTEHKLRNDLYYSLSAFVLRVPPLRERREDIPCLVEHFLRREAHHFDLPIRRLSSGIMQACEAHFWPGNLRQLQNVIRQYAVVGDEQFLLKSLEQNSTTYSQCTADQPDQSPREARPGLKSLVRIIRDKTERDLIVNALRETEWNRKLAAQKLLISYRSLLYKIEEYHLTPSKKQHAAG